MLRQTVKKYLKHLGVGKGSKKVKPVGLKEEEGLRRCSSKVKKYSEKRIS